MHVGIVQLGTVLGGMHFLLEASLYTCGLQELVFPAFGLFTKSFTI